MPARSESDLRLRAISAAVMAALGIAALLAGGGVWAVLVIAGVAAAASEWASMCRLPGRARLSLMAAAVACVALAALGMARPALWIAVLLAAGAAAARQRPLAAGLPYVVVPGVALVWLRDRPHGAALVLLLLFAVWATDTGAYLAGRRFGGPKLAPSLSPKKTWSGAAGGLAAAILVGLLFGAAARGWHAPAAAGLAALLSVAAQAGDLLESAAKRRLGVKDSGTLIPGHGGLLDRVDGLMVAAPLAALLVLAS